MDWLSWEFAVLLASRHSRRRTPEEDNPVNAARPVPIPQAYEGVLNRGSAIPLRGGILRRHSLAGQTQGMQLRYNQDRAEQPHRRR